MPARGKGRGGRRHVDEHEKSLFQPCEVPDPIVHCPALNDERAFLLRCADAQLPQRFDKRKGTQYLQYDSGREHVPPLRPSRDGEALELRATGCGLRTGGTHTRDASEASFLSSRGPVSALIRLSIFHLDAIERDPQDESARGVAQ